jgi:hypothetical protein
LVAAASIASEKLAMGGSPVPAAPSGEMPTPLGTAGRGAGAGVCAAAPAAPPAYMSNRGE